MTQPTEVVPDEHQVLGSDGLPISCYGDLRRRYFAQKRSLDQLRNEVAVLAAGGGPVDPDSGDEETWSQAVARLNTEVIEKEAEVRRLLEQHTADGVRIESLTGELGRARQAIAEHEDHRSRFAAQVRDVAIRVAGEKHWCDEGLNQVLAELGLELKVRRWRVVLQVTATQRVTTEVTAADVDTAHDLAVDMSEDELRALLRTNNWYVEEVDVADDASIRAID